MLKTTVKTVTGYYITYIHRITVFYCKYIFKSNLLM